MKTISRSIKKTTINASAVHFEGGQVKTRKLAPVFTGEKYDSKVNYFSIQLGEGETAVIESVEETEKVYEVPVDKFIELAESLEKKEEVKAE